MVLFLGALCGTGSVYAFWVHVFPASISASVNTSVQLGGPYITIEQDMTTLDQIKHTLSRKKPTLAQAGITEIGLFGSYVRGEQRPDSDLDVLIEIERPAKMDLLKLIDLEQELSNDLGVSVDLVMKSSLRPSLGKAILSEVVYL